MAIVESRRSRVGEIVKNSDKDGKTVTVADNVERSKLVVQAYFKRAGQLNKALGDKLAHTGADGEGPAVFQIISTIPRPPKE
jgi:hypothetical protein